MRHCAALLGTLVLGLVLGTVASSADEESVALDKIPKAVKDSLLARFPRAKIDKCTKTKEDGDTVYDIEFKDGDRKCESDIKENGTYVNFEKAIAVKDLPKAVKEAIDKKYPGATMKDVMEETEVNGKDEKLSAYEVVLETADKKEVEVRMSPDGKILEDTGAEAPKEK